MIDIEKLQADKAHLIDSAISEAMSGSVPNLHDAISYHMESGGKKLRPLLAIVTYEALAKQEEFDINKIIPFAAACEVFHGWVIEHDDIEDGDLVRRNKPAVWVKYGLAHGINIGDYMAHKTLDLVLKSKDSGVDNDRVFKLLKAMSDTATHTAEGQTMDINLRNNNNPTEKEYIDMVTGKTAHYLTAPMVGAAIVADRENIIPELIEFGKNLGPAFQITDDILDLTEGKGRGEIGRDIKEGKRSMLVVHCLRKCNESERADLLQILNKPPEETTNEEVLRAKALFEKHGSVEYASKRAEEYTNEAKRIADTLPDNLREILHFFADYVVKRRK